MANSSSTSSKTKKNAQDALDRFKMEVASEIGVNLKEGYNGDLTSAEAGSVGGNMVKKMIKRQEVMIHLLYLLTVQKFLH